MHNADALRDAIALGNKVRLPIAARSLTRTEVIAYGRRAGFCVVGVYCLLVAFGIGMISYNSTTADDGMLVWLAPLALLVGVLIIMAVRRQGKETHAYRDPNTLIEAREDGINVRQDGVTHHIDYREVVFELHYLTSDGSTSFQGMMMQSAIGPIHFENLYFLNGRNTAAAIIARWAKLGDAGP